MINDCGVRAGVSTSGSFAVKAYARRCSLSARLSAGQPIGVISQTANILRFPQASL